MANWQETVSLYPSKSYNIFIKIYFKGSTLRTNNLKTKNDRKTIIKTTIQILA